MRKVRLSPLRREVLGSAVYDGIKWVIFSFPLWGAAMLGALAAFYQGLTELERGGLYGFAAALLLWAGSAALVRYRRERTARQTRSAIREALKPTVTAPAPAASPPPSPSALARPAIQIRADGSSFLQAGPAELQAYVKSLPPAQRDEAARRYVDLQVRWKGTLARVNTGEDGRMDLQLSVVEENSLYTFYSFFASVEPFPGLALLDDKTLITVEGAIRQYRGDSAPILFPAKVVAVGDEPR